MDLKTYCSKRRGLAAAVARSVGVTPVMVSQWSAEIEPKPIPVDRCVAIERATDGSVRRWDLRPDDWHEHWPELIGAEGAPEIGAAPPGAQPRAPQREAA